MTSAEDRLQQAWTTHPTLPLALASTDHKVIGKRYIATAFAFFALAGVCALGVRTQLARPNQTLIPPDLYNELFTMHGTTMIFLFATPMLSGFGNYLLPLMLGSRDMAFPRLNAFSYWVFLAAGVVIWSSFLAGSAPDGGWFGYVPLTGPRYSPDIGIDFWTLGLILLGVSTTAGAINFIVTILKLRAPGMSINRMPLFAWAVLATSTAVIFAIPSLTVALALLEMDRRASTHFFDPTLGGDVLLWQHLFWIFGHPDVYIIVLPALGIVSTILPTFVRRPIEGYLFVALATMVIGVMGFGVWVHHMFATGLPQLSLGFFSAASLMIVIPSGIQIFAWLATIWKGQPVFRVPFLWILGFIAIFVLGGISGAMFPAVPVDQQVTDSYFVVAHFHYVLVGGAVFPIFGALYYWLPKMTGHMLSEQWGRWSFGLAFVGFNLAFFPMHISGLLGMPRRIYTYHEGLGWDLPNLLSTVGSFILGVGILVFVIDFLRSLRVGPAADANPWDAGTLEWATSSPPAEYNFREIPIVHSADPLWDQEAGRTDDAGARILSATLRQPRTGAESLATDALEGTPDRLLRMPVGSLWPLVVACGLALVTVGLLIQENVVRAIVASCGGAIVAIGIGSWAWSSPSPETSETPALSSETEGPHSTGWWGTWGFILTEAAIFTGLLFSYWYLRSSASAWPLGGIEDPQLTLPIFGTFLLLLSSAPAQLAELWTRRDQVRRARLALLFAFVMAAGFIVIQGFEYVDKTFRLDTNVYGSLFFVITGLHGLHVVAALLFNAFIQTRAAFGRVGPQRLLGLQSLTLYWHFVGAVWIAVFVSLYLSPRFS